MGRIFTIALVCGLAIASVNAFFVWLDFHSHSRALRTFIAWLLAFVLAGLIVPTIAQWLLTNMI